MRMWGKRALMLLVLTTGIGQVMVNPTPSQAIVAVNTTAITPSSFARNAPAPAFTIEFAGDANGGGPITWTDATISLGSVSQPWALPSGCPTTAGAATTTWSLCGVSAVTRGGVAEFPSTKIWKSATNTLTFDFVNQGTYGGISYLEVAFAAGAIGTPDIAAASTIATTLHTSASNGMITPASAAIKSAVTFEANGGTGTMADQLANTATALSSNTFARTNYSFAGWNTVDDGSGTPYAAGVTYSFANNITLYAQ